MPLTTTTTSGTMLHCTVCILHIYTVVLYLLVCSTSRHKASYCCVFFALYLSSWPGQSFGLRQDHLSLFILSFHIPEVYIHGWCLLYCVLHICHVVPVLNAVFIFHWEHASQRFILQEVSRGFVHHLHFHTSSSFSSSILPKDFHP